MIQYCKSRYNIQAYTWWQDGINPLIYDIRKVMSGTGKYWFHYKMIVGMLIYKDTWSRHSQNHAIFLPAPGHPSINMPSLYCLNVSTFTVIFLWMSWSWHIKTDAIFMPALRHASINMPSLHCVNVSSFPFISWWMSMVALWASRLVELAASYWSDNGLVFAQAKRKNCRIVGIFTSHL